MRIRFLLFIASLAFVGPVPAHDAPSGWQYAQFCCNGDSHNGDCQKIPATAVRIVRGGFEVTLAPGDHRLATRRHVFHLSQDVARRSQDGAYHLCLYPTEDTPRCFYAPDMGSDARPVNCCGRRTIAGGGPPAWLYEPRPRGTHALFQCLPRRNP